MFLSSERIQRGQDSGPQSGGKTGRREIGTGRDNHQSLEVDNGFLYALFGNHAQPEA